MLVRSLVTDCATAQIRSNNNHFYQIRASSRTYAANETLEDYLIISATVQRQGKTSLVRSYGVHFAIIQAGIYSKQSSC